MKKLFPFLLAALVFGGIAVGAPSYHKLVEYFASGSAAAPGVSFIADPDTGLYSAAANTVGIAGAGVTAMTVTPGTLTLTKASTSNLISSDTTAAVMTSAVPAFRMKSTVTPDAEDMLFEIMYGSTSVFSVDKEGDVTAAGAFTFSPADVTLTGGDLTSSHATQSFNIVSDTNAATTDTTVAAIKLKASADITNGDLILSVQNSAAGAAFTVDEQGLCTALTDVKAAGNNFMCSGTAATCQIDSAADDNATSTTVGAFTMKASVDIGNSDLLLDVQDSAANHVLKVTEAGALTALTSINATTTASIGGGTAIVKVTSESVASVDIPSAAAATTVITTAAVAGATLGDTVICQPLTDDAAFDEGVFSCFVESAGVVKIVYHADASGGDPASMNWRFTILRF